VGLGYYLPSVLVTERIMGSSRKTRYLEVII
jgi:hypothetical protein